MSDEFDHMEEAFLQRELYYALGVEYEDCGPRNPTTLGKHCKFCYETGLHWRKTDQGWRLYKGHDIHICDAYKKAHQ